MWWPRRETFASRRPLVIAALVAALAGVLALGALAYADRIAGEMRDFEVYWQAGQRALAAEPLYRETDGHYQFKYLPGFALAFAPLAALPLPAAKAVWFAISVVLLGLVLGASIAFLPRRRRPIWLLVVGTLVVVGKFYAHELVLGQTNLAMVALTLCGLGLLASGRDGTAGAAFGAAAITKPYAVLLLPYLLVIRRVRAATGLLAVLAVTLLVPLARYGVGDGLALHARWLETIVGSSPSTIATQDNISLFALFAKWLGPGPLATALALGAVAGTVALFARVVASRPDADGEYLEIAAVLTLVPLMSPQGWDYVLLAATPAVALTIDRLDRLPRPLAVVLGVALVTMGLSLFDLMGRAAYAAFMSWSILTLCALALLGALGALRARRLA